MYMYAVYMYMCAHMQNVYNKIIRNESCIL